MSDLSPIVGELPLRGSKPICLFLYQDDSPKAVRRLYNEAPHLPLFQLVPGGPFHAFPSRLLKHLEALSTAKEQEITEAAMRAAEAPASSRSRHLRKSKSKPAHKAVAARKVPARRQSEAVS